MSMEEIMITSDALDYKGAPANRSSTGGWLSAATILGVELCERLCTVSIAVNLVTYLAGVMHLPAASSSTIVTNWLGISFLCSILGGILADSLLGRFWTIVIFATVDAMGTCLLAVSTVIPNLHPPPCNPFLPNNCTEANGFQMAVFYIAIYTVALGLGGIKSSVSGFGADQFDKRDEKEKAQMKYFFNRFYLFISIGTLLAVTVFVYIQEKVSRVWAYGICTVLMVLAVLVFLSGTIRYRYKKRTGSPILQILQVLVAAVRKRKLEFPESKMELYETHSDESRIVPCSQFSWLDKAAILDSDDKTESGTPDPWRLCSLTKVEEIKMMSRMFPIWATTIMFWTVHAQMITFAVVQASTMKRSIGSFQIPAASFTAFLFGAILVTLAIYDRLVITIWKNKKGATGLTNLQKIGLGLLLSIIAVIMASIVETKRLEVSKSTSNQASTLPISAFLLVPQFLLVGAAEGFVYSGQLDFFLTESPKGMKAISTSLFLTTISLGYFVSSVLVLIVRTVTKGRHEWIPDNLNSSRLNLFYGLIAILSTVNLVLYLCCAKWFVTKKREMVN